MKLSRKSGSAFVCLTAVSISLAACGSDTPPSIDQANTGPTPALPQPASRQLIPTVDIAPAVGWPANSKPTPAPGLAVNAFASDLDHPRTIYVLPNGDVLVTETNAPPRPEDNKGIKGKAMNAVMKRAGAGVPSANRITLLRDRDGDGVAELKTVFLGNLMSPFGLALIGETLYIANSDALVKVSYIDGATSISEKPVKVIDLPGGPINHHWTKSLVASSDGTKLYVGVGSNSNVGENGLDKEAGRALIMEVDPIARTSRTFASGIRNPTALAVQPDTKTLWAVANERDELGDNLVPDYLTSVKEGAFYGWPYSYYGQHVDVRVNPQNPTLVAKAIAPDYALGSHVAALGLAFYTGRTLPDRYRNGAFIGLHGSWNRKPPTGYEVVFVPFVNGRPLGPMEPVLTDFVNDDGDAQGRPVGVAVDARGAVLVADDVGNKIWRINRIAEPGHSP